MTQFPLPTIEELLLSGGDARLDLSPQSGLNKYGCSPLPDARVKSYGSSTASNISDRGMVKAKELYFRLKTRNANEDPTDIYGSELEKIRSSLIDLAGLSGFKGLATILAASGTDIHLLTSQLAAAMGGGRLLAIMVEGGETGSGVQAALGGKHFCTSSVFEKSVPMGEAIKGNPDIEVVMVPCRNDDGTPRSLSTLDAEVGALIEKSLALGRHVLLNPIDVSKTGLLAPSVGCSSFWHEKYPNAVHVLIDACQFRLSPATLRAYIEKNFWVALTGSKFVTGPAFSGVVFIPAGDAALLAVLDLPQSLRAYSAAADWPSTSRAAKMFKPLPNFGLLLRWQAALGDLAAFATLKNTETKEFFEAAATAIQKVLSQSSKFEPVPVPELKRGLGISGQWDDTQTIFPFMLKRPNGVILGLEETAVIYRNLAQSHIQLGQPVMCGSRDGKKVSALRLCLSARLATDALSPEGQGTQKAIADALTVLEKTADLLT